MRLFKSKDPRINAGYWSLKQYFLLCFALSALTGNHMVLFLAFFNRGMIQTHTQLVINVLGGYVVVMAMIFMCIIAALRHVLWNRPMRIISEAVKQIACGNFQVHIPPLRKDGKKDFFEALFDDFNMMAEELAGIETMKHDFIANVSHEIKTPLSVIQSYAGALQSDTLAPEERKEYAEIIVESTQKLTTLVSGILKLNKLENQEILAEAEPFDLAEQLRRCAIAFEELWERKNITFDADLEEGVSVCGDERALEIVWNNLFSNAVKFTPDNGSILITLTTEKSGSQKERAAVTVKDSGPGMDSQTMKRIFDKFYQGDTSHAQEGNGLGLALARRAVELSGGSIAVESEPGKGAVFTVRLKTVKL
jgi:signal transduction histidine kinase